MMGITFNKIYIGNCSFEIKKWGKKKESTAIDSFLESPWGALSHDLFHYNQISYVWNKVITWLYGHDSRESRTHGGKLL